MRVTTAFNKMLAIEGASVRSVIFTLAGIEVGMRRRARRLRCPCGWSTRAVYDRSTRRWRHLDLGASRLILVAEVRRLHCRRCRRVRTEQVPWARPTARFTRDFEDVVAWLAQRTDKTAVCTLMRCSWQAVATIVTRVVAEHIDDTRLDRLYRIGVDEVSYRKGHRYLTVVADHDRGGAVVWAAEGKSARPPKSPHAAQCVDPFHLIKLANDAIDTTRRWAWNQARPHPEPSPRQRRRHPLKADRHTVFHKIKHTRWALPKDPADLKASQQAMLAELRATRHLLWRAYEIKESLRDLYRLPDPSQAPAHLDAWLARACRSRIPAMVKLSQTIRTHRDQILAAVELGLSNAKLEGLNSKIRLINHRGYGHHTPAALIAMIYLCAGGITIVLPTGT